MQDAVETAVIQGAGCAFLYRRLGMICNRKPRLFHHEQIVGAVAHGNSLGVRDIQFITEFIEEIGLGLGADDITVDLARDPAVADLQVIGQGVIEAEPRF